MMNFTPLACATCQLNSAGAGDSASYAILFMLAVVVTVLIGIVILIARMARREHDSLDPELCDDSDPVKFAHQSHS